MVNAAVFSIVARAGTEREAAAASPSPHRRQRRCEAQQQRGRPRHRGRPSVTRGRRGAARSVALGGALRVLRPDARVVRVPPARHLGPLRPCRAIEAHRSRQGTR